MDFCYLDSRPLGYAYWQSDLWWNESTQVWGPFAVTVVKPMVRSADVAHHSVQFIPQSNAPPGASRVLIYDLTDPAKPVPILPDRVYPNSLMPPIGMTDMMVRYG